MIGRAGGPVRRQGGLVFDDFNRAAPLGSNWTVLLGNATIVGSAAFGASAFSGIHIANWVGSTLGADQFAEGVIATGRDPLMQAQVYLRRRAADGARYALHYDFEFAGYWEIKYDGVATEFTRSLATSVAAADAPGSVLRLETRGTGASVNLKAYHNNVLIMEADDTHADRITSGPPGLVCREAVGAGLAYPSPVFASFAAGTLL